jgi:hypothetical protein
MDQSLSGAVRVGPLPEAWRRGSASDLFLVSGVRPDAEYAVILRVFRALGSDTRYLLDRFGAAEVGPLGRPHQESLPDHLADGISLLTFDEAADGDLSARLVLIRRAGDLDIIVAARSVPVEAVPDLYESLLDLLAVVSPNGENR